MADQPVLLRSRHVFITAMQFDGTDESAARIGRWLKRDTRVVHGVLFTVGRGGAQHHGPRSCWVTKHRDGSIGTKLDEVIAKHYEPAPTPQEDAKKLAAAIMAHWKASRSGGEAFMIGGEKELVQYLTDVFQMGRKSG